MTDFFVFAGEEAAADVGDEDLSAEGREILCEFATGGASADDKNGFGWTSDVESAFGGEAVDGFDTFDTSIG